MKLKYITLNIFAIILFALQHSANTYAENAGNSSNSNLKPFEWDHYNCQCTAQLDTSKISSINAKLLIDELRSFKAEGEISWTVLHNFNQEELERERDRYLKAYEIGIKKHSLFILPNSPELNKYAKDLMLEQKLIKYLYTSELNYLITDSTTSLDEPLEGYNHLPLCEFYSKSLSSEQNIKNALPEFIDNQCKKNVSAENCKARLTRETSDLRNAKIQILMLGWHNCVNHYYRSHISPDHDKAYTTIQSYMKDIKCECEDAD